MQVCQICGNDIAFSVSRCPYCGNEQKSGGQSLAVSRKTEFRQKTINLETGLPTVQQALTKLEREIKTAHLERYRLLTLIHGYGSTGKGGRIRLECRRTLDFLCSKGEIVQVVHGENFNNRHGVVKHLLSRFPDLSRHPHLNKHNKGITIVLLS